MLFRSSWVGMDSTPADIFSVYNLAFPHSQSVLICEQIAKEIKNIIFFKRATI